MAKAAYCALCGSNVYVTEEGGCPNGHSSEFLSNFYEVPDPGAPSAPEPEPTPEPMPDPAATSFTAPAVPSIPTPAPPSGTMGTAPPVVPAPPVNIPGGPMPVAPAKKSRTGLIIGIIVALLLCCIGGAAAALIGGVNFLEDAVDEVSTSVSTGTVNNSDSTVPSTASGTVRVELRWDQPVDMDLEIWTGDGQDALTSAGMENFDSFDGTDSGEYIDFKNLSDIDLSTGTYVVSVYFAEGEEVVSEADVRLIVTRADGSTVERTGTVYWEPGMDQWHAFSINAQTGEIQDIDQFIEIEMNE